MLFRALFWFGLVALLMPHEGGPGEVAIASLSTGTTASVHELGDTLLARLNVVKKEIEAAERTRAAHGG